MILRFVLDGKMLRVNVADPTAADGATETGAVGDQVGMAVLIGRLHGAKVYLVCVFELDIPEIPGRQGTVDIGGIHHGDGAITGKGFTPGVFAHGLGGARRYLHECFRIRHAEAFCAPDGDGLEVFRPHYRAYTRAAGRPVHVVDHTGIPATVFGTGPYRGNVDQRVLVRLFDCFFSLPDGPAPQMVGGQQADPFVFDMEVDGLRRLALQDEQVVPCELEFGAELAAGIGTGYGIRQRALGNDRVAPSGRGHSAGQRSGCKDQFIFRRQGVDRGVDLFKQVFCTKTPLTEVGLRPFVIQRFDRGIQVSQVDA